MDAAAAMTRLRRMPRRLPGVSEELPPLLRLAGPVVVAELGGMSMGLVDTMMLGRVSAEAIGAGSVGANLFHFVAVAGVGILLGLDFLVAHAFGGGRLREAHRSLVQSLWLCVALAALLTGVLWLAHANLHRLGIEPAVLPGARAYLRIVAFSMLPFLWFVALRRYLQAIGLVRAATFALISANLVNAAVNWVLIFGHLGAPALGIEGAAWATTLSRVYMLAVLVASTVWYARRHDRALFRTSLRPDLALLRRICALGLPASAQVMLEGGVFTAATLLAAGLDPLSLAAHQIALGAAAFSFMVPLGVASAGAVRVGQELGAGRVAAA
ncbi:MAG: MATE family efflux transporter, partial [Thermodesulfobacteriota bacterium]